MKKQGFIFGFVLLALAAQAQQKISDGSGTPATSLPAAGSILEVQSTHGGIRFPQIALTNTATWAPLSGSGTAATSPGTTVYNTNTGITSGTGTNSTVYPAFGIGEYYWDGFGWVSKNASIPKTEYLQTSFGGTQIFSASGATLTFGGTTDAYYSPSNSITFTTNSVTLQPGRTYLLEYAPLQAFYYANGSSSTQGNAYASYQWFAGSTAVGQFGFTGSLQQNPNLTPTTATGQVDGPRPYAKAIVTPTVATTYTVKTVLYFESATGGIRVSTPSVTVMTLP
ncbi:hypothetical protein ACTHGU_06775 [Chitinophagaceae bacterium MMS25-I14]